MTIGDNEGISLIVAEYGSLRAEIAKLIELQAQLQTLTVIAFGTVLSVGFQAKSAMIVLIHPLLALILGVAWLNHAQATKRIAIYIEERIEEKVGAGFMGWEKFVRSNPLPNGRLGYWGVRSIFGVSSIFAVIAGTIITKHGVGEMLFYWLSVATTLTTISLFFVWREEAVPSPSL